MKDESYYDEFLDDSELPSTQEFKEDVPAWVSQKNSSYASYQAILSLQVEKTKYIRKHSLKSDYKKKSNYQVKKSEVAKIVKKNAQPLFNSNSYSDDMSDFLKDINKSLNKKKDLKISSKAGLQNKKKEDLIVEHKELMKSYENSQEQTVDGLYQKLLDNLPLDIKRKLKIG